MRRLGAFVAAGLVAVLSFAAPALSALQADESSPSQEHQTNPGGPPPWASSVAGGKHDKLGLGAWQGLTPAQREHLMTRLAKEHAAGMKAYRACRTDGRTDCEKPLPPGLAKRQ